MSTTKILTWGLVFTFIGCGGRPTELLQSTQDILANAELSKKCAPEEYAAAENMYAKAQKLADDGEYDEAGCENEGQRQHFAWSWWPAR